MLVSIEETTKMYVTLNFIIYPITLIIISVYGYFWYSYKYWSKKKVPYLEPKFPYGNLRYILCKARGYNLELMELYSEMKSRNWKFGGFWTVATPVLMVNDPEYVKDILTKDFGHFIARGMYYKKSDPLSASLFVVDETKWKFVRAHLTPTFTTGKMKMMFPLIIDASNSMMEAFEKSVDQKVDIDIREFLAKFTTDVIVSCAFGLEGNSFKDVNHPFRNIGKYILDFTRLWESIRCAIINYAPDLSDTIGIASIKKESINFFYNIITKTVNYRKENNVTREDFLQLVINMVENTKNSDNPFTYEEMIANVNLFFIAGFDTSSSAMNFALYELARHPDIQERLRKEIQSMLKNHNGELTYELINEMKFLQQVVDETLRIYPSVPILQRKCVKDYKLRNTDIQIDRGTYVVTPIISIHRDPEYFPDPLKFDPERFSPENRDTFNSHCYMPFGDGPRNCIGLRFGLMQTKIGIIKIINRYRLSISPSTKMPLELDERVFLLKSAETLYLKAEKL